MKLLNMKKVHNGQYMKNYELTYQNKAGSEKTFELVSRNDLHTPEDIGRQISGITVIAFQDHKLLLLKEFRMSINRFIYNLCAGILEPGETIEECIHRELLEETGLRAARIIDILPASYSAVGFADTSTCLAFVETEGTPNSANTSDNEEITAAFYTKEQIREMLPTECFSSRSQLAAYFFEKGMYDALT